MSGIPRRPLGKDGEKVSMLCLGGGHIGRAQLDPDDAVRIMQKAVDEGITFFDNAYEYNQGESERRMGRALEGRRDKVFLMTKVCSRDRAGAESQLHESLERLRTDHLDLWQFHEINYGNDPEWIFAKGGAAEAAEAALASGKVRHVGFTGHKDPSHLIKMLDYDFPWSCFLMPVNILDPGFHRSFIREVLPVAKEKGVSVLGMKSLGGMGQLVTGGEIPAEECLRFALSQPIASLVSGIDSLEVLEQNLRVARDFQPMDAREQQAAVERYRHLAADGRLEWFKTTQYFDSRVHRDQHAFPEVTTIN